MIYLVPHTEHIPTSTVVVTMYKQGDIRGGYTLINNGNLPRVNVQPFRPTGIHLSGILSRIHGYADDVAPETQHSQLQFTSTNLMILGQMFEYALAHWFTICYPDEYIDPPKLCKDGIHLTPDLYHLPSDSYCEVKLTRKSARACPGGVDDNDYRFSYWEQQLKSYCHADNCNTGRLMVCHINGLYRWLDSGATKQEVDADDVVFNIWERTYTDAELLANWAVIVANKGE